MRAYSIVILLVVILFGCGEEKSLPIAKDRLVVNEPEIPDSVCASYENISDYDQHYRAIMGKLPPGPRSLTTVRDAFKRHIEDSSLKDTNKGVFTYYLNHGFGLHLHGSPFPNNLDSLVLMRVYRSNYKTKGEK